MSTSSSRQSLAKQKEGVFGAFGSEYEDEDDETKKKTKKFPTTSWKVTITKE